MNSYDLLQRGIRKYIYDAGWESLRGIQEASIKHVHNTENNLILAAPTASGKTEAAFLPAINSIKDWDSGLKIVYISPLIALINDQFRRIYELCNYINVPVTSWHGEASRAKKNKLLKDPKGILLITPESIEAMLCLRPGEAKGLFRGTEWIIVDEIHSFLGNNRGIQLRSLIERIKLYMEKEPRFIGMSATLNREDYKKVKSFFISERATDVLLDSSRNPLEVTKSYYESNAKKESREALEEIYDYSQRESMLVFPNSRAEVERLAVGLSRLGKQRGSSSRYFAHHSSVSKDMRLTAEKFAKDSGGELFTIC
ncbi:MAG TPA: DEAD/DEAH box helicase, partial [Clostridiaceae bacterium]|nr:DEAD/DEAH box helicase [Clostridiaceae bacterium]